MALAVLAALACAPAQAAPRKVTVGILYLIADAGVFVAKERGYFAEEGLEVEFSRFKSGAEIVALLATDKLDAGSGGATPGLFNAYIRGVKAPIVSSKAIISREDLSGSNLLVRSDLIESGKVKTVADLKGMRIVVNNIQSPSLNYVMRGIAKGGLGRDDITLLEMPFEQFIPALQNKAADAVMAFSPLADTIATTLKLGVPLEEASPRFTADGDTANMMFYSPAFLNSEAGKGFMVAHLKGLRDYQRAMFDGTGDRGAICAIIRKYLTYLPESCAGISMSFVDPNGEINVASLERYQNEWVEWGIMRQRADIRANIDTGPLDYALKKLGRYQK